MCRNFEMPAPETPETENPAVYLIHESHIENVRRRFETVARKCAQFGNPAPVFEMGAEKMIKSENGNHFYKFFEISISGGALKDGGKWEFVAKIEIAENGGHIIKNARPEIEIPARFRDSKNICDECHTARDRNNLYIVRNRETGEFRQIGGNCLQFYTGADAATAAAFWDGIINFGVCADMDADADTFGQMPKYFDTRAIIETALIFTEKIGYSPAREKISTKYLVSEMFDIGYICRRDMGERLSRINKTLKNAHFNAEFTAADFAPSAARAARVDDIINYYLSDETGNSEFAHNARAILSNECASADNIGILACMPAGFEKACARAAARAEIRAEYFGEIGGKYKNIAVKSARVITEYGTYYGPTYVCEIVTADNFALIWKTSKCPDFSETPARVSFGVKAHNEYRGTLQTIVTRCKFE